MVPLLGVGEKCVS